MMKALVPICLLIVISIVWQRSGISSEKAASDNPVQISNRVTVAPYDSHEACLTLNPRETLHYTFETSIQSYFNIHYHDADDEAFYPVPEHLSAGETSSFSPETEAYYCLMWTNANGEGLELSLDYRTE